MCMPIIKSAKKRVKTAEKRTIRNREWKDQLKNNIKDFEKTIEEGDSSTAGDKLQTAIKTIDKAVSKGIIHQNNAARKKSRLTKMYNKIS